MKKRALILAMIAFTAFPSSFSLLVQKHHLQITLLLMMTYCTTTLRKAAVKRTLPAVKKL